MKDMGISHRIVLLPADIVLTRSTSGWLGPVIRWFQRRRGDPAWSNHVGIITRPGIVPAMDDRVSRPVIVEALWHVRSSPIWESYGPPAGAKRPEILVYRPSALDSGTRTRIAAHAEQYVGRRYGWWQLVLQAADRWISRRAGREVYVLRALDLGDRVICSQLVGRAYGAEGLTFGVPAGTVPDPDAIEDYCREHPDKYTRIFGPGHLGSQEA